MGTTPLCPNCRKPLAPDAPQGLCQECLLKAGFPTGADTAGKSPRFVPPTIAELAAKFPQLEILEFIGQGGMGAVYKARQKQLNRLVALKILPPGIGEDPAFAQRFAREAQALAQLNHPGIVTLYEFGQADGLFYFLMEFVDGVNLRQLLRTGRVSAREALAIVPQICDALQFAHDQGLVHRDIKPENILLDRRGRVKVADFGVAKLVGTGSEPMPGAAGGSPALTESGKIMGTPSYMAPEQVEHPAEVDHRADIYALGVVFYQMLTGELPGRKIQPPSRKVQVDVRLDEIVLRAMEKDPERRYQHVSEVGTDVETISRSMPNAKPKTPMKKLLLLFVLGAGVICVLFAFALLLLHGKSARTLTVRAFIDGSDVIKVSGDRLWIEHDTGSLPGKAIYINGQAWTPTWTTNSLTSKVVSSEFVGLNPPFQAGLGQGIQLTNTSGRGVVSFEQFPSADNAETLAVRLDDESFGGADWYEILISWDERNKSKAAAAETGLTIVQGADVRLNNPVEYSTAEASVQDIVQNLAEQAGLKYDRQKSLAQTDPICRRWVQNVTIHGKTCQQALEQILKPVGLRCQVENGILVLSRQPTSTAAVTNNLFSNVATMLKNPQQREALRAGQKMMVDQMYGALPLPADRLTALKELLLDRLMAMAEPGLSAMTGTAADRKQAMGTARAIKEEYDQKIQALLGQQEYRVFQEYDKTVTERLLVQTFKNTLPAEARLSTTQEDALLSAMHDEATASQTVMKNNLPPNSIPTSEDLSRQLKLFQQNTLKRASTILTPQQLDQFKNWQEQMATVQTAALKQMFDNSPAP